MRRLRAVRRCREGWLSWFAAIAWGLIWLVILPPELIAAKLTFYVQPSRARVRLDPSIHPDNLLDTLPRGVAVTAFEPEGEWYPVQLQDGRSGWMHQSVLGRKRPQVVGAMSRSRLPVVRIGIVQDGEYRDDPDLPIFKREIRTLLKGEYTVQFPPKSHLTADWSLPGIRQVLDQLLASPHVDMVLAYGPLASQEAGRRGPLSKPVFAPFVIDPTLQDIPFNDGVSGVRNFSYITAARDLRRDIQAFLEVTSFTKLAILVGEGIVAGLPKLRSLIDANVQEMGIEVVIVPVGATVQVALEALPSDVQAVYVPPLNQLAPGEFRNLVNGLIERRLPSFSMVGRSEVEQGLLVSTTLDTDTVRLARRIALNMQRTLLGEDPATFPVKLTRRERMTLNMATARAIDLTPPWEFLTQMDLIQDESQVGERQWSLVSVVQEAVRANLDVRSGERLVAAGAATVGEVRSGLFPQLTAALNGRVIDDDRSMPERLATGTLSLSQLLYNEPTWANLSQQKSLQIGRQEGQSVTILDVVLETAVAYLNVLSAKTVEDIRRENLNLTRTNLELSRVRRSIGVARPNEVLRWEIQTANNERDVIDAFGQRRQAEIALNRVMHRPLEEVFSTIEPALDDPVLITNYARVLPYVDNPRYFAIFREFLVREGLATTPELRQVEAQIAAQERALDSAQRSFWSPRVELNASVTGEIAAGGKWTDGGLAGPGSDEVNWEVGIQGSLPLFTGGGRRARHRQARETLAQLRLQREASAERIAAAIRARLFQAGTAYANIDQTREAAAASQKNLDLITDSYTRGAVSILDLLDAQSEALTAKLNAANQIYVYLIELMNLQRAVGQFDFFLSDEGRGAWFERLDTFFRKQGATP